MANRKVVGVLRGGKSSLYDISVLSGQHVLKNIPEDFDTLDIFVARDGTWHVYGAPVSPEEAARKVDIIFNALHGGYGEDGKVQHILESLGVPYTGSQGFPSMLSLHKHLARDHFKKHGFKIPHATIIHKNDDIENALRYIFNSVSPPWVIKPTREGASLGVSYARSFEELRRGVEEALEYGDSVLVEEYINGKEVSSLVVEGDGVVHVLPPVVIQKNTPILDYETKQQISNLTFPEDLSSEEHWMVKNIAAQAHKKLGLRHYSRVDCIIDPKRGVFLLEVNSLPGLHRDSLVHKSLRSAGTSFKDFLGHVLDLAHLRK
ncbi:hypothetical protein CL654_02155 [bacterium]|nr:hypothetical protein [bacterium]|tara:strand:- start:10610 stop:11566 length:957 start_codon:yes stop_codon:yes gene_type:complete